MKWNQYTIYTTEEAEELVTSLLFDMGITNCEVRDSLPVLSPEDAALFEDVMPALPEDTGEAEVVFYLDDEANEAEILEKIREGLEEMRAYVDPGTGRILREETEDKDWVNNWKEHFKPFSVDDILIKPTWTDLPEEDKDKLLIEIDPGTAFGTGSHETTRLCIHGICRYVKPGSRVLDVGTGSGILGIIAVKKGAASFTGTDIDPLAVEAAEENAKVNGLESSQYRLILGDIISDPAVQEEAGEACYDVVLANILADVIIPLQKEVVRHMKQGAYIITSGIINLKEEAVKEALLENPELEIVDTLYEGEWVSFIARRS